MAQYNQFVLVGNCMIVAVEYVVDSRTSQWLSMLTHVTAVIDIVRIQHLIEY